MSTRHTGRIIHRGTTVRLIATVMIILILLAGCGEAAPTTTPAPPAHTVPPTPTRQPPLSDGGVIAYCYQPMTGGSLHQIYTIHVDGRDDQKLIESSIGLNHHGWSPDGQKIAYDNQVYLWGVPR